MKYNLVVHPSLCLRTAVFFGLQSLCLVHTEKPSGVAVYHCITWFSHSANPHYSSDLLPRHRGNRSTG